MSGMIPTWRVGYGGQRFVVAFPSEEKEGKLKVYGWRNDPRNFLKNALALFPEAKVYEVAENTGEPRGEPWTMTALESLFETE